MNATVAVLVVILLQQGLVALLWAVMAWLRLARAPALHWAAASAGASAGLVLIGLRDSVPAWAGYWLANGFILAAFMVVRRGLRVFAERPAGDAEQLAVWALTMGALAFALSEAFWAAIVVTSWALGYAMLGIAWTVRRHLADEFGSQTAARCAAPFAVIGAVFVLRGLVAAVLPQAIGRSIHADNAVNVVTTMVFLVCGLLLHAALLALVLARVLRRLRHQSEHDELTGLLNRRAVQYRLRDEADRLARYGHPYSLLSIDVDHFKRINDRFGHPAGDAVLQALARSLRQAARSVDHAARAGGEEFWMLAPSTGHDGALQLAERVRRAVAELLVTTPRGEVRLTVSIGVAVADHAGEPLDALMQRLDAALYRAKQGGRDRVELAMPAGVQPVEPGQAAQTEVAE